MQCLILNVGYVPCLYPLTEYYPKPLQKVNEKTVLDWLVDDIDTLGLVDEYVVISNHKYAVQFDTWPATKRQKVTVVDDGASTNETRLGAVKDIQFAINKLGLDDEMLVIAGDNVLDSSLTKLIAHTREKQNPCVMRCYESDAARLCKSGVVRVDEKDRIICLEEKPAKPKADWCTPPFCLGPKEDARLVKVGIEEGCGTDDPDSRYAIGNLESYQKVQKTYHGITK